MADRVHVHTHINDEDADFLCEPRQSLLEVLRDVLGLTGSKEGCNDGNCGACTVILDGKAVKSCTVLAVRANGSKVTTIEGLAEKNGDYHPLQNSFWEKHGLQCGFCTPGIVVAAKALLDENPDPTIADIRRGLAGNLCRCTGYQKIIEAITAAGEEMRK